MKVSIIMSGTKQVTPNRCYCRVQDEGVSLNEIARIITGLNLKILRLRNEVSALKDINSDGGKKLFKRTEPACRHLSSSCCNRELDASRSNVKFDDFIVSTESKALANFFENNPPNKYRTAHKIKDETVKNAIDLNNFVSNGRLQVTDGSSVYDNQLKRRKKKISQGVQCDLIMERKRKRTFLNCFKTEPLTDEYNFSKANKKRKLSAKNDISTTFDSAEEAVDTTNIEEENNEQIVQLNTYGHSEENPVRAKIDQMCKLIGIESKKEKWQETKIFKNELTDNVYDMDLPDDTENECQFFKYSINRMGGGAEFRGNRLMSDFHDKIQKINLYKNVKFDAKNVKKRLDACIDELNGIIEDVSLIFPNSDISKEL
ncbi:unnamed protein product [Xylocopa violacea]|uniref:Uncharacterized protein n=1 Tax=Xylocopa violacea TaxID=135666 RepID=A0ABP1P5N5_XYLVO